MSDTSNESHAEDRRSEGDGQSRRGWMRSGLVALGSGAALMGRSRARAQYPYPAPTAPTGYSATLPAICPVQQLYQMSNVWYYSAYEFVDPNCTWTPNLYSMSSVEQLTTGCQNGDCVSVSNILRVPGKSLPPIDNNPSKAHTKNHRFGKSAASTNDASTLGLNSPWPNGNSLPYYDKKRARLLDTQDYSITGQGNLLRVWLFLFTPEIYSPLVFGFGQEIDKAAGAMPSTAVKPELMESGKKYVRLYRADDDIFFHVLTATPFA